MEGVVRWPKEDEERYRRCGYWEDVPLGERFDGWVAKYGDRPALAHEGKEVSYREMGERATRLAARMLEIGIKPYDRVIVQLFNVPELIYVFYACMKIGAIPLGTLPTHRSAEIGFIGQHTEARVHVIPGGVVKGFDYDDFAQKMRKEVPSFEYILTIGAANLPGMVSISDTINNGADLETAKARLSGLHIDASEPAMFQLSGGTTGTPKVIPRTHNDYYYNAKCVAEAYGFVENDRNLVPMPLMHNGPMINAVLPSHVVGACCVLTESFAPESILRAISENRATSVGSAVVLMHRMLEVPVEKRRDFDLSSVKFIWWSGNIEFEDQMKLRELFHNCDLCQNYGMAEGMICFTRRDDPIEIKMNTVGRPVSEGDEVRLVDVVTDEAVPRGEVGEVWCRGPYTIRGYYKAPERNREAFSPDGFYKTGDLAKQDQFGNLMWAGRIKDCISRGGEKINAEEVEVCIRTFPKVLDVAVVAMPDKALEERVCAFVVPKPGEHITLEELNDFLLNKVGIAPFKVPERLEALDELPLTKVGKADKKKLRAMIAEILNPTGASN
ncbi:MAG: AMP-binding protein [Deltaproteobacteria bacterium]|nr:AMP-binding protein [Deltaproteobacteria bacterium]